jgi:hypothetical protein
MFSNVARDLPLIGLVLALVAVEATVGQTAYQASPAAPVPAQIASARKVFIANAGADIDAQEVFKKAGEPEQAYNHFYAAMQKWGHYELVSNPADADLVFEIRFAAPMYMNGNLPTYQPQFGLNIVDVKTHFALWSLGEPVEGAFRKATWLRNFDRGLDALMDDVKKISGTSSGSADPAGDSAKK